MPWSHPIWPTNPPEQPRDLRWIPPPQVEVQLDHSVHSSQTGHACAKDSFAQYLLQRHHKVLLQTAAKICKMLVDVNRVMTEQWLSTHGTFINSLHVEEIWK